MPRDGSGNYTLPVGNPVISGTTIESNWANTTMEDIAIALTNSLSRNGNGGMLAPLGFVDGTEAAPGMFFVSQVNMGLHRANLNDLRIVLAGSTRVQITDGLVNTTVQLQDRGNNVLTTAGGQTINGTLDVIGDVDINGEVDITGGLSATGLITTTNNFESMVTSGSQRQLTIYNTVSGGIQLRNTAASAGRINQVSTSGAFEATWIGTTRNAGVELYYNNSSKLITRTDGVDITGQLDASGELRQYGRPIFQGNSSYDLTDCNNADGSRVYSTSSTASNRPISGSLNGVTVNFLATNGNNLSQFYTALSGTNPVFGFRSRSGGTWSDWRTMIHDGGGQTINGDLSCTGSVTGGTSDIRTKDISSCISPNRCLNAVLDYSVIRYKDKPLHQRVSKLPQIGLVANEVEKDFPELVCPAPFDVDPETGESISGENYLTLKYERMVSVLVGAIQGLNMEVEELTRDLTELRSTLNL